MDHPSQSNVSQPPPPRRSRFWLWLLLFFCAMPFLFLFLVYMLLRGVSTGSDSLVFEEHHSLNELGADKVAIIAVEGLIMGGDGFVKQQIDRVREDTSVKAIVLRVDSPGGTVTGSDYIYHHLKKLRDERKLPMVVSMGGMAASGGYYVSMAVGDAKDAIFAEPTTWTGSIGVVIPHYNVAGLMEEWEVEEDSIKSHPLKQMGSPTKKLTEEERKIFQELVDDSFARFKDIVKNGRPDFKEHPEKLDAIATGQVFTTNQALANGLVDKEGFIEEAIDRAIALAKLNKENVRVVEYGRPPTLADLLLSVESPLRRDSQSQSPSLDLSALLELTTPRAYYLSTWLPTAIQSN